MRSYDFRDTKILIRMMTTHTSFLENIANQISLELDSDGRSLTDIRRSAVKDIAITMFLLRLQYIYISECLINYKWWDEHGFEDLTSMQKNENASKYAQYVSFSAFHQAYSIYEGCLRQIHHSLDSDGLNQSTGNIQDIFNALIPKLDPSSSLYIPKLKEVHIFLGLIRNTIHNNGCYRNVKKPVQEVMYNGSNYRFEHLQPVLILYPEMLSVIIYDIGFALCSLIRDPNVKALTNVKNPYLDNLTS